MNPKDIISQKVEDFAKNEKVYKSKDFQETEARNRFIDPLFEALGWNLNQTNVPRKLWDVHREYSQKDNSSTKKPDYAFRVDAKLKFFVEAKAPHVLLTDKDPVFQAKRYAYSTNGKAPIIILTDFEEFRVFNALQKPNYDNPLHGVLKEFDFKYVDYLDKWDLLVENFSREAVLSGSLDRLRGKISKSTKKLDEEFLDEMVAWRENLAKHIAIKNESLNVEELNEAVQRILDRLIFIRQLEDRNIVDENTLFGFAKKENLYKEILPLFGELNGKYNGLLFKPHFSEKLIVEDKVLKETILDLCYPRSPFQFDVIEPEILGRIYERFLGSKIRLTDSHRAKVEEKDEVRHAGGVYYTPEYIVNYIVKETVGKKTENKTPEEISKIKILDPACGSGSFLLGAYQYLLNWHVDYYRLNRGVNPSVEGGFHKTSKRNGGVNPTVAGDFFFDADGEIKLTTKKKGEILVNNIFGVDIDREATEVAILSLYLKLLEEGIDDDGFLFLKGKVLPDMTNNIKCGNSLISREDLYNSTEGLTPRLIADMNTSTQSIAPLDWDREFPFDGFDCIIGNPPYIRIQELQKWAKNEVELYKKIYKSGAKGNFDIYILFIEKGLSLINQNGLFGMILPNKFLNSSYGEEVRGIISKGKNLSKIVHFGDIQIFDGATTYTCLLFLSKSMQEETKFFKVNQIEEWIKEDKSDSGNIPNEKLTEKEWNFQIGKNASLFQKLEDFPTKLSDVADLFVGLQTDGDSIFILEQIEVIADKVKCFSKETEAEHIFENSHLKFLVKGSLNIKRYSLENLSKRLIFPYYTEKGKSHLFKQSDYKNSFPATWEYLELNKKKLTARNKGQMGNEWYGYVYKKNHTKFDQKKILVPSIAMQANFAYDSKGEYYFVGSGGGGGGGYGITIKEDIPMSYQYLLGLLNSKLLDSYLQSYSSPFRGGYFAYNRQYIEKLPIYIPNPTDKEKFPLTGKIEELVKQILEFRKKGKTEDAEFLESKIDEIVEKLYGVETGK